MSKIFRSELYRILHFKLYWLECIVVIIFAVYPILLNDYSIIPDIDGFLFQTMTIISFFSVFLVSQFIGDEYVYGTVRNKIIIGHSRIKIYFAELILNYFAVVILFNISVISVIISGVIRRWKYNFSFDILFKSYVMCLCTLLLIVAICLLVSMNSMSKILSFMSLLAVFYILSIIGADACNKLAEPEMRLPYEFEVAKEINEPLPNKMYQSGNMRSIYENILLLDPCGQAYYESESMYDKEEKYVSSEILKYPFQKIFICSIIEGTAIIAAGILIFCKKDLK